MSCSLGVGGSEGGGTSGTQVVPPVPETEVPAGHTTHRCRRSPLDQAVASSVRLGTGVRHAQDVEDWASASVQFCVMASPVRKS